MFTRCPECETIFRLGAHDLRRAAGKVRCGECESVFNALEYLEEKAEQLSPVIHSWPTEPANDADSGQPEDSASSDSDDGAPDTLSEDNYADQSDRQADHPVEESGSDTGLDSDEDLRNDTGAGILVIDPTDDYQADAETNQISENSNEFSVDSAVEDGPSYDESAAESDSDIASAAENKYGSAYAEPENDNGSDPADDEIVSFITPNESTPLYPEVSEAVSKAIATSRQSSGSNADDQDETRAYDVASWSGGLGEEIDIGAADATVEFIISDDQDDIEEEIITIITDEADNDIDDVLTMISSMLKRPTRTLTKPQMLILTNSMTPSGNAYLVLVQMRLVPTIRYLADPPNIATCILMSLALTIPCPNWNR